MARLARVVVPRHSHHLTPRGNGPAATFFGECDYALYRDLLAANCAAAGVEVWAWCLMPNHVHLILVPADADGLRRALASTQRGRNSRAAQTQWPFLAGAVRVCAVTASGRYGNKVILPNLKFQWPIFSESLFL